MAALLPDDRPENGAARAEPPLALSVAPAETPVLAVGAGPGGGVCVAHRGRAHVSAWPAGLEGAGLVTSLFHRLGLAGRGPRPPPVLVHDLAPDSPGRLWARASGLSCVPVQQHHARVAACLAEHERERDELVLGVVFDDGGYGADGRVGGGEIFEASLFRSRRVAHLRALPGRTGVGPAALAAAALEDTGLGLGSLMAEPLDPADGVDSGVFERRALPSPCAARWFAAIAGLAGLERASAPVAELEAVAARGTHAPYALAFVPTREGDVEIDLRPVVRAILLDRIRRRGPSVISARFHETLARAILGACAGLRSAGGPATVVLTGACFENRRLLMRARALLEESAFEVLVPTRLRADDAGLAYGQAAIAAASLDG